MCHGCRMVQYAGSWSPSNYLMDDETQGLYAITRTEGGSPC